MKVILLSLLLAPLAVAHKVTPLSPETAREDVMEYEGVQCWFDTNRTMDHDHNHIRTREQLKTYDDDWSEYWERLQDKYPEAKK